MDENKRCLVKEYVFRLTAKEERIHLKAQERYAESGKEIDASSQGKAVLTQVSAQEADYLSEAGGFCEE